MRCREQIASLPGDGRLFDHLDAVSAQKLASEPRRRPWDPGPSLWGGCFGYTWFDASHRIAQTIGRWSSDASHGGVACPLRFLSRAPPAT